MTLNSAHQKYDLTPVINAAGTYTPLGVSRSSEFVAQRTAQALRAFFERFRLQEVGLGGA
jgi:seryl-tRNA(Sec) selenium transferase